MFLIYSIFEEICLILPEVRENGRLALPISYRNCRESTWKMGLLWYHGKQVPKERQEKLDIPGNKIKPSSVSDSAKHEFGSFALARVCTLGLFLQWVGLFFMQVDPVLLLYLSCEGPAAQVSALPWDQALQAVLPLLFLIFWHGHVLLFVDRLAALIATESATALPVGRRWQQAHSPAPGCGLAANPSPIQPPILTPYLLVTLQSRSSPNSLFLSLILCFAHSAELFLGNRSHRSERE